ncbi:MAG: ABC-type amino acid transport substrate-binding protein [Cryomorphaceae bacterium]|jgi:ABC-type amino acid transport substrate-binding protein
MQKISFWNGNKTSARQNYESELLGACLKITHKDYGSVSLHIDNTDYPLAEGESTVFHAGADILVTVAGNLKFKDEQKIVINQPLAKGLLGYRLLLVRDESLQRFKILKDDAELQGLCIGIPQTWADAGLFRHNDYDVVEKGTFDELLPLLKDHAFDYTALGVNEIEEVFKQRAEPLGGISIEPSLMLYYPFPLVFYVNHRNPALAERIDAGLTALKESGEHDRIFTKNYGDVVQRLGLKRRRRFNLSNPILPPEMGDFESTLLD